MCACCVHAIANHRQRFGKYTFIWYRCDILCDKYEYLNADAQMCEPIFVVAKTTTVEHP